jgi:hypothetical protein
VSATTNAAGCASILWGAATAVGDGTAGVADATSPPPPAMAIAPPITAMIATQATIVTMVTAR